MFKRILIKLSGDSLLSINNGNITIKSCPIIHQIKYALNYGIEVAIVIGGGNIARFSTLKKNILHVLNRVTIDHIGMLSTIINALSLSDILLKHNINSTIMSSKYIDGIVDSNNINKSNNLLSEKKLVIFAGGTGNPFVTTDTAASLRACEIKADAIFKATNVDGIYDEDPKKNTKARILSDISFDYVCNNKISVMDIGAFIQCREFNIPICVFNMNKKDALKRIIHGEKEGTWVR